MEYFNPSKQDDVWCMACYIRLCETRSAWLTALDKLLRVGPTTQLVIPNTAETAVSFHIMAVIILNASLSNNVYYVYSFYFSLSNIAFLVKILIRQIEFGKLKQMNILHERLRVQECVHLETHLTLSNDVRSLEADNPANCTRFCGVRVKRMISSDELKIMKRRAGDVNRSPSSDVN